MLVLSLFPGIGLLDLAFEEEGFCIVRGPDQLWGGDIKRFNPPKGILDNAPFTLKGKHQVIGNGVPLPMGKVLAKAITLFYREFHLTRKTI